MLRVGTADVLLHGPKALLASAALATGGAVMVAQRANNDIALVADGEGARQRCCARRRHGCKHQWQKRPNEAMAREKAGR
jgi:hypothetical protein